MFPDQFCWHYSWPAQEEKPHLADVWQHSESPDTEGNTVLHGGLCRKR